MDALKHPWANFLTEVPAHLENSGYRKITLIHDFHLHGNPFPFPIHDFHFHLDGNFHFHPSQSTMISMSSMWNNLIFLI